MAVLLLSVIKLIKCCRDTSSINKVPSHAASLQQMIFFDVQTLNMIMSVLEKTVTFISIKGPCGHYDKHIVLFTLIILTLGTCQRKEKGEFFFRPFQIILIVLHTNLFFLTRRLPVFTMKKCMECFLVQTH